MTNVVGPAYVAQAFSGLVEKSAKKTIVNISSTLGSMGADFGTRCTSYSVTKAALNMLVRMIYLVLLFIGLTYMSLLWSRWSADLQGSEGEAGGHCDLHVSGLAPDGRVLRFLLTDAMRDAHASMFAI